MNKPERPTRRINKTRARFLARRIPVELLRLSVSRDKTGAKWGEIVSSWSRLCLVEGDIFFPGKASKPDETAKKGAPDPGRLISGKGNPSSRWLRAQGDVSTKGNGGRPKATPDLS
jgi:hypothetical protein